MEKFYEISSTATDFSKYNLFKNLTTASLILALLVFMYLSPTIAVIICILVVLPMFLLKRNALVEYDYEFNSGELTISAIYEKKRRKEKGVIFLKEIELMAPVNSTELNKYSNAKVLKCYSNINDNREIYSIVVRWETQTRAYHIALDKTMVDLCFYCNPQKVLR
ncbi:hypothetical protein [Clostridium tarantellae]|uniref:Uncharacterized protein n=1 Tax=Clostridium tarantellae TaxID=39493 RepID=A0A6I1MMC5_9CLOT|nr:hypothetical protein [Clostridium tarantellae]MPQ44535.1 hypothetical protein [Clostridium tarantellae]